MKTRLLHIWLIAALACMVSTMQAKGKQLLSMDSVEISLITCSPHEEIYSLYGHSALRFHDLRTGYDMAMNWGIFNFNAPHFVLRFMFGLTDYELGAIPFKAFCEYYRSWHSQVTEQVLNLTDEEKLSIAQALNKNLEPQNRVYRYNFFYDNCSTRPRNIVEQNINGKILYDEDHTEQPSFRQLIHSYNELHPWAALGNDLLLGAKADQPTTRQEQEFLPEKLMSDFAHAQIMADGVFRPLVKETRIAVKPGVQIVEREFIFSPTECSIMLLALALIILSFEWKKGKTFRLWDAILMLAQGIAGVILTLMLFSQHPTTSTNLQVLLLNPLPLIYIYNVWRGKDRHYFMVLAVMIILFIICGRWQTYAEGMIFLALVLLSRVVAHWMILYKKNKKTSALTAKKASDNRPQKAKN